MCVFKLGRWGGLWRQPGNGSSYSHTVEEETLLDVFGIDRGAGFAQSEKVHVMLCILYGFPLMDPSLRNDQPMHLACAAFFFFLHSYPE